MSWKERFNQEFFNSDDDVAEYYCTNVRGCNACGGSDMNGEPNGYGCEAQEDYIEENIHKVLSERTDACNDIKDFIEALLKETEQRVLEDILKNKETMYKQGLLATFVAYPYEVVRVEDIEQLKEKYKGVEQNGYKTQEANKTR